MHLWLRAENTPLDRRTPLMPAGAATLIGKGFRVTVEHSPRRLVPIQPYTAVGCQEAPAGAWRQAPEDAVILGIEPPEAGTSPLDHRHIMFGRAFDGQSRGRKLIDRLRAGGGRLYDLDHVTGANGRRLVAFSYWSGFIGTAVALLALQAQTAGGRLRSLAPWSDRTALLTRLRHAIPANPAERPCIGLYGEPGRTSTGAAALCAALGLPLIRWNDPHPGRRLRAPGQMRVPILLNCEHKVRNRRQLLGVASVTGPRDLRVVADLAFDADRVRPPFALVPGETEWTAPILRLHDKPPLDVMAVPMLPALLPRETSEDFSEQLLPLLELLPQQTDGPWAEAAHLFDRHCRAA